MDVEDERDGGRRVVEEFNKVADWLRVCRDGLPSIELDVLAELALVCLVPDAVCSEELEESIDVRPASRRLETLSYALAIGGPETVFSAFPLSGCRGAGRGGGRISPSLCPLENGRPIEEVEVVEPYMLCGLTFTLPALAIRVADDVVFSLPPPAAIRELVGLAGSPLEDVGPVGTLMVGEVPLLSELRDEASAALLTRGAGAAAAREVSMLSPLPLSLDPVVEPGCRIDRVREGRALVEDIVGIGVVEEVNLEPMQLGSLRG